jgi:hypothetical protein
MTTKEGVTPSRPRPQPRPSSPEKPKASSSPAEGEFDYAGLPRLSRRRVTEVLGPALRAELAEYMAEKATRLTAV